MKFMNWTGKDITVFCKDGSRRIFPSVGEVEYSTKIEEVQEVDGISFSNIVATIENVPDEIPGTTYIVSMSVFEALNRKDFVCPGKPVRDRRGDIVGFDCLCTI